MTGIGRRAIAREHAIGKLDKGSIYAYIISERESIHLRCDQLSNHFCGHKTRLSQHECERLYFIAVI